MIKNFFKILIINFVFLVLTSTSCWGMNSKSSNISLSIIPEEKEYTTNQIASIEAAFSTNNHDIRKLIIEDRNLNGNLYYNSSRLIKDYYYEIYLPVSQLGVHRISVTGIYGNEKETAVTYLNVISIYESVTAIFLYIAGAFFIALLVLVILSTGSRLIEEILRFIFLSGIIISILLSLLFTTLEIGEHALIGLVQSNNIEKNSISNDFGGNNTGEWVVNIGGLKLEEIGSYHGGVQIPVYVIVFGLAGGYIRYLYKTSRFMIDDDFNKENDKIKQNLTAEGFDQKDMMRRIIFYQSLKDIMLFFLAPLLAIAIWFLFSQWQPTSQSTNLLAVFSFAAGLTTTEIINTLTNFTKTNLNKKTSSD